MLDPNHKTGSEKEVYVGPTLLDTFNKYVEDVLTRGYGTSIIDYVDIALM